MELHRKLLLAPLTEFDSPHASACVLTSVLERPTFTRLLATSVRAGEFWTRISLIEAFLNEITLTISGGHFDKYCVRS